MNLLVRENVKTAVLLYLTLNQETDDVVLGYLSSLIDDTGEDR